MPILTPANDQYEFRMKVVEDGRVEIRIVMPNPVPTPCDLKGPEARKRLGKWIMASASGMATMLRVPLEDTLRQIYEAFAKAVDYEHWIELVVQEVVTNPGTRSPRSFEETPPKGMDARQARVIVQHLLDNGDLALNESLKLIVGNRFMH